MARISGDHRSKIAHATGKFLCVWKKQPNGGWKAIRDMWNYEVKRISAEQVQTPPIAPVQADGVTQRTRRATGNEIAGGKRIWLSGAVEKR